MVALCVGLIYSIRNSCLLASKEARKHARKKKCSLPPNRTEQITETHDWDRAVGPISTADSMERSWESHWLCKLSFLHHITWHNQEVSWQQLQARPFACQGQVLLRYGSSPLKPKSKTGFNLPLFYAHIFWHWRHNFFDCFYTPFV